MATEDEYGYAGGSGGPPPAPPPYSGDEYGRDEEQLPTAANGETVVTAEEEADGSSADPTLAPSEAVKETDGFFGPRMRRIVTLSLILLFFSLLAMPRWFDHSDYDKKIKSEKDLIAVYDMHAAGVFIIFVGSLFVLAWQFVIWRGLCGMEDGNRIVDAVFAAVLCVGAVLYAIAGAMYADYYNAHFDKAFKDSHESLAGIVFFESMYVSAVTFTLALDLFFNWLSISQRVRIFFIFSVMGTCMSLLLFFCYTIVSGDKDFDKVTDTKEEMGCIAAGWFLILVACTLYLATEFAEMCCCNEKAKEGCGAYQNMFLNVLNVVNFIGAFLVFAGMWAYADELMSGKDTKSDTRDQVTGYYIGYGFFVVFVVVFMATDISWGKFMAERICGD